MRAAGEVLDVAPNAIEAFRATPTGEPRAGVGMPIEICAYDAAASISEARGSRLAARGAGIHCSVIGHGRDGVWFEQRATAYQCGHRGRETFIRSTFRIGGKSALTHCWIAVYTMNSEQPRPRLR